MSKEQDRIKPTKTANNEPMKKGFGSNKDADKRKSETHGKDDKKKEFDKKQV